MNPFSTIAVLPSPRLAALVVLLFSAAPGAALAAPDRGYEQISPVDKNGNAVGVSSVSTAYHTSNPLLFAEDANSALFAFPASAEGAKYGLGATFRAVRTAGGWQSSSISPGRFQPQPAQPFSEIPDYYAATADTSKVAFSSDDFQPGFVRTQRLDLMGADGTDDPLSVGSLGGPELTDALFGDLTPDGKHMVFQSSAKLEPTTAALADGTPTLYERLPEDGVTRVAGVLPDGSLPAYGSVLGTQPYASLAADRPNVEARNALSRDGSHIVFSAFISADQNAARDLYARIDGDHTVAISEAQRTTPGTAAVRPALFQDANASGSVVYFLSDGQLTDDDSDAFVDLYRFRFNGNDTAGTLTRISAGLGDSAALDNHVALVGASQDGDVVYFVSQAQLGGEGVAGVPNLYVSDHGQVSFIATVSVSDGLPVQATYTFYGTESALPSQARVTPDGGKIVLQSFANLTAFDAGGKAEIYSVVLGGAPACLSCSIVGGVATGDASLVEASTVPSNSVPRNLSNDGKTVVFQSRDALAAEDTNTAQDVYEWHDGLVSLVSGGKGPDRSILLDASGDDGKRDIFFLTSDQLAWSDTDTAFDLYTARRGGGFPEPPALAPECVTNCQGAFAAVPFLPVPGSTASTGAGNPEALVRKAAARFVVGKVTTGGAAKLARRGTLTLPVRANGKGRVTAKLSARIGGRWVAASGSATQTLKGAGTAKLTVKLSKSARKQLARARKLPVRIDVRFAGAGAQRAELTLRLTARSGKR